MLRPHPHRTRARKFDVACVQCGHPHSRTQVPFALRRVARPVWMRSISCDFTTSENKATAKAETLRHYEQQWKSAWAKFTRFQVPARSRNARPSPRTTNSTIIGQFQQMHVYFPTLTLITGFDWINLHEIL